MKKLILTILLAAISSSTFAITYESAWTQDFKKVLNVTCNSDDAYLCADLCGEYASCQVREKFIKNAGGDNLFLRHFFNEIGTSLVNAETKIDNELFIAYLKRGNFATIDSRSIYNNIDKFNSFALKEKFRSLCPEPTEYPIVFVSVDHYTRELKGVSAVACTNSQNESDVFDIKKIYSVEVNE